MLWSSFLWVSSKAVKSESWDLGMSYVVSALNKETAQLSIMFPFDSVTDATAQTFLVVFRAVSNIG